MRRYYLEIRTKDALGVDDYRYYGTSDIVGKTLDGYMEVPQATTQGIVPEEYSVQTGTMKCKITNFEKTMSVSKDIYGLINSVDIMFVRQRADVRSCLADGTDDRLEFRGIVRDVKTDAYDRQMTIEVADLFQEFKQSIFSQELAIIDSTERDNTPMPTGYSIVFEDTGELDAENNPVTQTIIEFRGSPYELIYGMIQLVFSAPALDVTARYLVTDLTELIDLTSLVDVTNSPSFITDLYMKWTEPEKSCYDFIKKQIFPMLYCYPYINTNKVIAFKEHKQPLETDAQIIIDEDRIISVDEKELDFEKIANHLTILDTYSWNSNKFLRTNYWTDGASFNKFKKFLPEQPKQYEFKLLSEYAVNQQTTIGQEMQGAYFNRFGEYLTSLGLTIIGDTYNLACGDYVFLDSRYIVAWDGDETRVGERGLITEEDDTGESFARFNNGDPWIGFKNADFGEHPSGVEIVKLEEEIKHEMFNSTDPAYPSCTQNHTYVNNWLIQEGF